LQEVEEKDTIHVEEFLEDTPSESSGLSPITRLDSPFVSSDGSITPEDESFTKDSFDGKPRFVTGIGESIIRRRASH
jgi:hypothetical protein